LRNTISKLAFDPDPKVRLDALSDVEKFAAFMRFLAPPEPSTDTPGGAVSIALGADTFDKIGCSACHTPELHTSPISTVAALRNKPVRLYSDLALHKMITRASASWGDQSYYFAGAANCTIAAGTGGIASLPSS
jgi:hypothetical protein